MFLRLLIWVFLLNLPPGPPTTPPVKNYCENVADSVPISNRLLMWRFSKIGHSKGGFFVYHLIVFDSRSCAAPFFFVSIIITRLSSWNSRMVVQTTWNLRPQVRRTRIGGHIFDVNAIGKQMTHNLFNSFFIT